MVGTDHLGKLVQAKGLSALQARQAAQTTADFHEVQKKVNFQTTLFIEEPAAFFIEGVDQGFVVRSLELFHAHPHKYYLPGFAVMDQVLGRKLALLNGSHAPASFWSTDAVLPSADVSAEILAFTGRVLESGHWQNFLFELDENFRPTGLVADRDPDVDLIRGIQEHYSDQTALTKWPANHIRDGVLISTTPCRRTGVLIGCPEATISPRSGRP